MADKSAYRISGIGKCPRAISAERAGIEPDKERPAWLDQAAEEGNWHESRVKHELLQKGLTIKSNAVCEKCLNETGEERNGIHIEHEFADFIAVGHMDGIVIYDRNHLYFNDEKPHVLEVKSMSQYEFDRWMRTRWAGFPQYADQLTMYMTIHNMGLELNDQNLEALYVVKNRNNGSKDIFVQVGTPSDYDAIVSKINDIEKFVVNGKLHPAEYDPFSLECKRCDFKSLCLPVSNIELTGLQADEMTKAAQEWREGREQVKLGDEKMTMAKLVLESHAVALSKNKTTACKYSIEGLDISGYVKQSIKYPRANVEAAIKDTELLESMKKVSKWWECRITDSRKEED